MLAVLNRGGNLALFPEGIQSLSGSTHPINPATCKFLKRSGATIVVCKSEGAYLCQNRFSKDIKKGKIDVYYDIVFTPEELQNLTEDQIYDKLIKNFSYNEFKLNKVRHERYVGKLPNADGLDKIIYKCPHCQKEFSFEVVGDTMTCKDCGYAISVDEYYDLHVKSNHKLYFDNIDDWFKWQRKTVQQKMGDNFTPLTQTGALYKLRTDKLKKPPKNRILIKKGKITLDKEFLTVDDGEKLKLSTKSIYSLTFSLSGFLEFYHENEYYEIELDGDTRQLVLWTLYSEEIHNLIDSRWAKASNDVYG